MKRGKVIGGAEARAISKEHRKELHRLAKAKGKAVPAGIYGSLWCPYCRDYTGQRRFITPSGREVFNCSNCGKTFSRGGRNWLTKFTIKKKGKKKR